VQRTKSLPSGVIADVIIPYSNVEEPDFDRLSHEVELLDKAGVHGLSVGGILGGVIGAAPDELSALCSAIRRSSKKPVFATVFPDAFPEACELVRAVKDGGADVILVAQPHYLAQPGVEGLAELFGGIRALVRLPLLLADCFAGSLVGVDSARTLVQRKLVDGVFEAADMHVLVDLLYSRLDVPVYSCIEDLHYPALVLGARGFISNIASVFPSECVGLYASIQGRDHSTARDIHQRLVRLWRAFDYGTEREARLRCALAARGRPVGSPKSPYGRLAPNSSEYVVNALQRENAL